MVEVDEELLVFGFVSSGTDAMVQCRRFIVQYKLSGRMVCLYSIMFGRQKLLPGNRLI